MSQKIILSAHYFPCIAYFAYLVKNPSVFIDLGEHFIKQSYRNRCIIYTSNGPLTMSIPVIKKNNTAMKDVLIDRKENWKIKHWRAISSAYSSSPFFEFYSDLLKEVLFKEYTSLTDLNKSLLNHLCSELDIPIRYEYSDAYIETNQSKSDLRTTLHPKKATPDALVFPRYIQTFETKHGFQRNLSILDLLFHEGPESKNYLAQVLK